VLDTLKSRRAPPYVGEVISARSIGESSFVSQDRRTTFLIAALTPESTHDLSASFVPTCVRPSGRAGAGPGSEGSR